MPGVLPEHSFTEILEHWLSADIVGDDPRPVVATTVASSPFSEPFEFTSCVSSIVSALAATAFPFILKIALKGMYEPCRTTACR